MLTPYDMQAALGAQLYGTKTRGLRHLPAAHAFAEGTYVIATHGSHAHLRWSIDFIQEDDPIAAELHIESEEGRRYGVVEDPASVSGFRPSDF